MFDRDHRVVQGMLLYAVLLLAGVPHVGIAQDPVGVGFLNVGPDARGLAMAEAMTAYSQGASAYFYNPAGWADLSPNIVSLSQNTWVGETSIYTGALKLGSDGQVGWGWAITAVTGAPTDESSDPLTGIDVAGPQFVAAGVTHSRKFGSVAVGMTAKFLHHRIQTVFAQGYAVDLGLQVPILSNRVRLGLAMHNLGRMEQVEVQSPALPYTLRMGVATFPLRLLTSIDDETVLTTLFSVDVSHRTGAAYGRATRVHLGLGAEVFEMISVRAGYLTGDAMRSFSFGGQLRVDAFRLDYAFLPFRAGYISAAHVITLSYLWN